MAKLKNWIELSLEEKIERTRELAKASIRDIEKLKTSLHYKAKKASKKDNADYF